VSTVHLKRRDFVPVREPGTNWLLFYYDPVRQLVEVQRRGKKTLIDLSQYSVIMVDENSAAEPQKEG
jgi:hypothetical protein